jgi:hypothetical protein
MAVDSMFWQQPWSIYPTKARVMVKILNLMAVYSMFWQQPWSIYPTKARVMDKILNYGCLQHVLATAMANLLNQGQSHGQDTQLWLWTSCFDNSHGPSTQPWPESWLRYSTMAVDSMFWQQSRSIYPTKARVMAKILNYGC